MERVLKKSGFYGLVLGLAVSILFVNYKDVQSLGNGLLEISSKSIFEYILTVLRIGIIGMFVGLFIGWRYYEKKYKTEKQGKTYYLLAFFLVFLISIIVMFVFRW